MRCSGWEPTTTITRGCNGLIDFIWHARIADGVTSCGPELLISGIPAVVGGRKLRSNLTAIVDFTMTKAPSYDAALPCALFVKRNVPGLQGRLLRIHYVVSSGHVKYYDSNHVEFSGALRVDDIVAAASLRSLLSAARMFRQDCYAYARHRRLPRLCR